jgi:hypothetical protein
VGLRRFSIRFSILGPKLRIFGLSFAKFTTFQLFLSITPGLSKSTIFMVLELEIRQKMTNSSRKRVINQSKRGQFYLK